MIRVLVVDDSAFMRRAISMLLEKAPDIDVVGTARDGQEALERVAELDPDVVTMDVEMPRLNGLQALRQLMRRSPRPVIMISSLTQEGAATTVQALAAGAVDFIPKEHASISLSIHQIENELHAKVRAAAQARRPLARLRAGARGTSARETAGTPPALRRSGVPSTPSLRTATPITPRASVASRAGQTDVLVIGVSTGGPFALQEVIPALPASFPVPVVIVQHMPPHFTKSMAERLDAQSALEVVEAEPGLRVERGRVIVARGGEHLALRRTAAGTVESVLSSDPSALLHRPSVDVLFQSAADVYGSKVLALVMTGMGKDGLEGATAIRDRGGYVLAQDEETCVVYGMPRAVAEAGVATTAVPLGEIAATLTRSLTPTAPAARASAA